MRTDDARTLAARCFVAFFYLPKRVVRGLHLRCAVSDVPCRAAALRTLHAKKVSPGRWPEPAA